MTMGLLVMVYTDEPHRYLFTMYAEDGLLFHSPGWKIDMSLHFSSQMYLDKVIMGVLYLLEFHASDAIKLQTDLNVDVVSILISKFVWIFFIYT